MHFLPSLPGRIPLGDRIPGKRVKMIFCLLIKLILKHQPTDTLKHILQNRIFPASEHQIRRKNRQTLRLSYLPKISILNFPYILLKLFLTVRRYFE